MTRDAGVPISQRLVSLDALRGFDMLWTGMNAITIYMAANLVDLGKIASRLAGGPLAAAFGRYDELVVATAAALLVFGLVGFLYRRKILLRV